MVQEGPPERSPRRLYSDLEKRGACLLAPVRRASSPRSGEGEGANPSPRTPDFAAPSPLRLPVSSCAFPERAVRRALFQWNAVRAMYTRPSLSDVLPASCVFLAAAVTPRFGSQARCPHPVATVKDEGGLAMSHSNRGLRCQDVWDALNARNPRTAGPPCADVCMSASRNVTSCARVRVVRDRTRLGCRGAIAARDSRASRLPPAESRLAEGRADRWVRALSGSTTLIGGAGLVRGGASKDFMGSAPLRFRVSRSVWTRCLVLGGSPASLGTG